jgi:tetratricopeptide (TPR) repeat protein
VRTDADRWLMPLALLGRYAAPLVAPWKLSPDYGATVIGWRTGAADPYLWAGALALCAWLTALVVALHRRSGAVAFCLIALGLTYAIVSNFLVLIGTIFGERLMYLPSVFFVILVAIALARLPKRAGVALLTVVLALSCLRSFTYAARWNDRLRFYETSLREQPRSIRLYLLLISEQLSRGEFNAAERLAREATEKLPDYWEVWIARANVAMEQGKLDEAERYLITAVDAPPNPTSPTARIVRWMTLLEQKKAATRPSTSPARSAS